MSGMPQQVEWYIARDGQRHGPISDSEMRKFIELGHLRAADLVWCAKFTQWQSASVVFGAGIKPPAGQSTPAAAVSGQAGHPSPESSKPQHAAVSSQADQSRQVQGSDTPGYAAQPVVSDVVPEGHVRGLDSTEQRSAQPIKSVSEQADVSQPTVGTSTNAASKRVAAIVEDEAVWAEALRTVRPTAAEPSRPSPQATGQQPSRRMGGADPRDDVEAGGTRRKRRDWIGVTAAASAVILIISGLAWITWQNRSVMAGATAIGSAIKAKVSSSPSSDSYRLSPYDVSGDTKEAIDASLQRTAVWRVLKRDHPEWYSERLGDIETRRKQNVEENVISRFLADVLVTLRRRNAQAALQSSPDHLRAMARTFGDNLRQLASRDSATCYTFISFGETTPFVIELSRTPAFAETLQRQLVAIFEAIGNGRAHRQIHASTRRSDYDQLTKELMTRGWTQNDLVTFSDPERLQNVASEKVCNLVQEWFATHLVLTDKELQVRLLAESLRPLVGG